MPIDTVRRRLHRALPFIVAAGALIAGGCTKTVRVDEWRLPVPEGAPEGPALDVRTFRGDVTVRADPQAKEIRVEAALHADGDSESLDVTQIGRAVEVSAVTEDRAGRPTLVVSGVTNRATPDHRVDVLIRVPTATGVTVRTGGGEVILVGVGGEIGIETGGGAVEVRTNRTLDARVSITTGDGNIYYQAPLNSTGRFTVSSDDGDATWEAEEWEARVSPMEATKGRFSVTLNGGENPVTIHTGKGDATISIMRTPQDRIRTLR